MVFICLIDNAKKQKTKLSLNEVSPSCLCISPWSVRMKLIYFPYQVSTITGINARQKGQQHYEPFEESTSGQSGRSMSVVKVIKLRAEEEVHSRLEVLLLYVTDGRTLSSLAMCLMNPTQKSFASCFKRSPGPDAGNKQKQRWYVAIP